MLRTLLMVGALLASPVVTAASPPTIAVVVASGRGRDAQTLKRALDSIGSSPRRRIIRSASLKKRLHGNPSKLVRKCKQDVACLVDLGKKAGVDFLLVASAEKVGAVLILVAVAESKEIDNSTVDPIEITSVTGNAKAMIRSAVERVDTAPAESAEDIAAAELAAAVQAAALPSEEAATAAGDPLKSEPSLEPIAASATPPPDPQTEGDSAAAPAAEVAPAPPEGASMDREPIAVTVSGLLGYRVTGRTWTGAGGLVLGTVGLVLGRSLRGRADELSELPVRATQIEVVQQEKSQHRAATGSTVSYILGSAFMTAGAALIAWDVVDGRGSSTVAAMPTPDGGVVATWETPW